VKQAINARIQAIPAGLIRALAAIAKNAAQHGSAHLHQFEADYQGH
jgi:hypothetical protein